MCVNRLKLETDTGAIGSFYFSYVFSSSMSIYLCYVYFSKFIKVFRSYRSERKNHVEFSLINSIVSVSFNGEVFASLGRMEKNRRCIHIVTVEVFDFEVFYCFVLFSRTLCASPFDSKQWLTQAERYVYNWCKKKRKYLWQHQKLKLKGKTCSLVLGCIFTRKSDFNVPCARWPDWCTHACACVLHGCWIVALRNYHNVLHLFVRTKGNNHQIQWRKCAQMNTYSLFKALCVTVVFFSSLSCALPVRVMMPITEAHFYFFVYNASIALCLLREEEIERVCVCAVCTRCPNEWTHLLCSIGLSLENSIAIVTLQIFGFAVHSLSFSTSSEWSFVLVQTHFFFIFVVEFFLLYHKKSA